MSRTTSLSPVSRRHRESSSALWIGWAVYGGIAFLGFCFGVWAGNQRPRTIEVVKPNPQEQVNAKGNEKQPDTNVPENKGNNPTPGTKGNVPPPQKKYEPPAPPPKTNEPVANVEPKKVEPKKVEPMPAAATTLTYDKDIKKILVANCQICHGDNNKMKGDFDVRSIMAMKKAGLSGKPGLTPGDPGNSMVWLSIEDGSMPEAGSGKKLTEVEKKMIKEWVAGGAK